MECTFFALVFLLVKTLMAAPLFPLVCPPADIPGCICSVPDHNITCTLPTYSSANVKITNHGNIQVDCNHQTLRQVPFPFAEFLLKPLLTAQVVILKNCPFLNMSYVESLATWFKIKTRSEFLPTDLVICGNDEKNPTVTGNLFEDIINLESLTIASTLVTTLPSDVFENLAHIKGALKIEDNKDLNNLPKAVFLPLTSLKNLSLASNGLDFLYPSVFSTQHELRFLSLRDNHLKNLSSDLFTPLIRLIGLDLGVNQIKELPSNIFHSLLNLVTLNLEFNTLNSLPHNLFSILPEELTDGESKPTTSTHDGLTGLEKLQELNLSNNYIKTLPREIFSTLLSLITLKLDNNHITYLPDNLFVNQIHLRTITLNSNRLTQLNSAGWQHLKHLVQLNLTFNNISTLNVDDLSFNASNVEVFLDHNNISSVDLSRASSGDVGVFVNITLKDNPLNCTDCKNRLLLHLLRATDEDTARSPLRVKDGPQLRCAEGGSFLASDFLLTCHSSTSHTIHENKVTRIIDPVSFDTITYSSLTSDLFENQLSTDVTENDKHQSRITDMENVTDYNIILSSPMPPLEPRSYDEVIPSSPFPTFEPRSTKDQDTSSPMLPLDPRSDDEVIDSSPTTSVEPNSSEFTADSVSVSPSVVLKGPKLDERNLPLMEINASSTPSELESTAPPIVRPSVDEVLTLLENNRLEYRIYFAVTLSLIIILVVMVAVTCCRFARFKRNTPIHVPKDRTNYSLRDNNSFLMSNIAFE